MTISSRFRLLLFVPLLGAASGVVFAAPPTDAEMQALSDFAFQVRPEQGDITVYRTQRLPAGEPPAAALQKVTEGIRTAETALAEQDRKYGKKSTPEELEQRIAGAIAKWKQQQAVPLILKQRIRVNGFRYRLDQVTSRDVPGITVDTDYVDTYVNMGNPLEQDHNTFHLSLNAKHAFRDNREGTRWAQDSMLDVVGVSFATEFFLKGVLGELLEANGKKQLTLDAKKMARLMNDSDPDIRIDVSRPSEKAMAKKVTLSGRDSFYQRVKLSPPANRTLLELTFDDQWRCLAEKVYAAANGTVVATMTREEFDGKGVPRIVKRATFEPSGDFKLSESTIVLAYATDPIAEEVFEFNPPEGFSVVDNRPGMRKESPAPSGPGQPVSPKVGFGPGWWLMIANTLFVFVIAAVVLIRRAYAKKDGR